MVLPRSVPEKRSSSETIPVHVLICFSASRRTRVGVTGQQRAGGANASGRNHAGPPFSYWRPGKGAGFPAAAAFGRGVTLEDKSARDTEVTTNRKRTKKITVRDAEPNRTRSHHEQQRQGQGWAEADGGEVELPGASGPGAQGPLTPSLGQASPSSSAGCSPRGCAGRLRHPQITAARSLPGPFPLQLCGAVWRCGLERGGGGGYRGGGLS